MSTGAECRFEEVEPGRWSYWLQSWPYGDSPHGETFGPFASFHAAHEHLSSEHANPGGWTVRKHADHRHEWDETGGDVPAGVTVSIDVESLGPDPDRAAVIAHLQSLAPDHPAWRIRPRTVWRSDIIACEACGAHRE